MSRNKAYAALFSAGLSTLFSCSGPQRLYEQLPIKEYILFAAAGQDSGILVAGASGAELLHDYGHLEAALVRASPEQLESLVAAGDVAFYAPLHVVEEDERSFPEFQSVQMNDDGDPISVMAPEWAYQSVHAELLQEYRLLGQGLRIGVLDSGIDPDTSCARQQLRRFTDVVHYLTEPYDDSSEDFSHGTFVSGIICRVLPEAELFVYKIYNAAEDAHLLTDILEGLDAVIADEINVINLSWGLGVPPDLDGMTWEDGNRVLEEALERVAAAGTMIVAAAGNGRHEGSLDLQQLPNGSPVVISVGATTQYGEIAPFSDLDAHLFAPGKGVYSDYTAATSGYNNGTSFSAPFVTAAVAVIQQARGSSQEQLTRDAVLDILLAASHAESSTITFSDGEERAFPFLALDYELLVRWLQGVE
ncbi:S8/S53 family peptidase [Candidatus Woesearchaeota archaeon]|nr:S8/S53 family peptidase [Candidatus Woesearchaeota archaeon]